MTRYLLFLILIFSGPLAARSQDMPKAYETVRYQGKLNGRLVRFSLASGYIGASSLKMYLQGKTKPLVFQPETGVADKHKRLKFVPLLQDSPGYFILENMQEAYEDVPPLITGTYYLNRQKIALRLIKT